MIKIQTLTGTLTLTDVATYDATPIGPLPVEIARVERLTAPFREYTHSVTFALGWHVGCLVTEADAITIATWRKGLKCCHEGPDGQCASVPTVGIHPDDGGDPYRGTHACSEHVGALLFEDRSIVTPIACELPALA